MKIGIFGGSFNPPHNMHINIGEELIKQGYLDKIIFVPTGIKYKYKSNLLPNENRFDMLKILTQKNKNFSVSNYEFSENVVYTCETLDYFKNKYLNDEIYFICGADNLSYIDKWKNGEEILKNYKIIVIARNTDNLEKKKKKYSKYTDNILVARIPPYDLSSTEIRKLISDGKYHLLDKYLDCDIIDYIIENNLYM